MADGRGRPRSFDVEEALGQALNLFWKSGYLGTSYADICEETGLTKPSLYAALGDKEATFLATLDLYVARFVKPGIAILEREPNVKEAILSLLVMTVEGLTSPATPPGCFIATNAACSEAPQIPKAVTKALHGAASQTRSAVAARLELGLRDAQLPPDTDIASLTCYYDTLIAGLSSLAKQGVQKNDLMKAVDVAMLAWPCD